jgi:hypothetical protein
MICYALTDSQTLNEGVVLYSVHPKGTIIIVLVCSSLHLFYLYTRCYYAPLNNEQHTVKMQYITILYPSLSGKSSFYYSRG